VPPKVTVSIKILSRVIKTFEVKLVSGVVVERQHRNGVNLANNLRSKEITVVSVGDLDVSAKPDDKLIIKKARNSNNQYSISIRVNNDVNERFSG
jgi:hypothetical protein